MVVTSLALLVTDIYLVKFSSGFCTVIFWRNKDITRIFRTQPKVRGPGAANPAGEIMQGVESMHVATPPAECNCISLHSTRSDHSWVGKLLPGIFCQWTTGSPGFLFIVERIIVKNAVFCLSIASSVTEIFAIELQTVQSCPTFQAYFIIVVVALFALHCYSAIRLSSQPQVCEINSFIHSFNIGRTVDFGWVNVRRLKLCGQWTKVDHFWSNMGGISVDYAVLHLSIS